MRLAMAYLGVVMIWSTTPLAIKWSGETMSFIAALGSRMALGAVVCTLLLVLGRQTVPLNRAALASYGSALLGVVGAMSAVYWSMQYIPSGLVSVVFGFAPILSGLFARWILGEAFFNRGRLFALVVSLAGLGLVFEGELHLRGESWPGLVAALLATALFSLSGVLVKRTSARLTPLAHTTGSLWFSLPFFALAWYLLDGQIPTAVSLKSALAVSYLALAGSVVGFLLYFHILQRLPAAKVALVPLITPAFALMLGALLAGERINASTIAGTVLILLGLTIYLFGARLLRGTQLVMAKVAPLTQK